MENTSGQGPVAEVPAEIDRWNWGAFLLNWIWGIGNNTWIALLMFVPFVNLVMVFVLGARGSRWAWSNKRWTDVEHFRKVQRTWALAGVAAWVALIGLVVALVFAILSLMSNSEAYRMGAQAVRESPAAVRALGEPISTGYASGEIDVDSGRGRANLSFSVEGPRGSGTVYLNADKRMGQWEFERIELAVDGEASRIDLMPALR